MEVISMSLSLANIIYITSNWAVMLGAVLAVVGSAGIYFSSDVREKYAEIRTAENETKTAVANAEAEKARLEAERIKQNIAWRRLTKEQHDSLVASFSGKPFELYLSVNTQDSEAVTLAQEIANALGAARVQVRLSKPEVRAVGLTINRGDTEDAQYVIKNFNDARLPLKVGPSSRSRWQHTEIIIGIKPPPF